MKWVTGRVARNSGIMERKTTQALFGELEERSIKRIMEPHSLSLTFWDRSQLSLRSTEQGLHL